MATETECSLVSSMLGRLGVLSVASIGYLGYTYYRVNKGQDKRDMREVASMFFILGSQQACGGILLSVFSLVHNMVHEPGFSPLLWYSANFDFETFSTIAFMFLIKHCTTDWYFNYMEVTPDTFLKNETFSLSLLAIQFLFSVIIVGALARILSMSTIVIVTFVPYNPIFGMAAAYNMLSTIITCTELVFLILYAKPAFVDAAMFIISEYILRHNDIHTEMI